MKSGEYLILILSFLLFFNCLNEETGLCSNDTISINNILAQAENTYNTAPDLADSLATLALSMSKKNDFAKGKAKAYKIIATIDRIANHNVDAINNYYKCLDYYKRKKDSLEIMEIYQWLGLCLAFEAYHDSGYVYLDSSLILADLLDKPESKAQSYLNLARLFRGQGSLTASLFNCKLALNISDSLNNKDLSWQIENFMAYVDLSSNKHKEAAEIINNNILHYKEYLHMPVEVCRLYYHKSTLDMFLQNYERIIKDQTTSLNISDKIANKNLSSYFKAMSHTLIGEAYTEMNLYDSAKYYLFMAAHNQEYILDLQAKAELYCTIGEVFYYQNKNDSALFYFSQSAILHKKNKSLIDLRKAYLGMGKTYFQMGNYKSAKLYLLKANNTEIQDVDISIISEASQLLSEIYRMENDYKKALKYHTIYKNASDELFNNEKIKNITQLELEYDLINKQREFERTREQEVLTFNAKLKQNRLTRNFAAAGFLLSLLVAIFAYRNYKIKQKANSEKETLLREIHHRVKNNLQIISSMLSLQGNYIKNQDVLNAINESQGRVKSMALIHQMLYQNDKFSSINIKEYITQLSNAISSTFTLNGKKVSMFYDVDEEMIDIDTAVPLGLIINELVTNSFKYAFKNKKAGKIMISFKKQSSGNFLLKIADNGIGMSNILLPKKSKSFGLNMVSILTRQLKGELKHENKEGTIHTIQFSEVIKTNNNN